ncbi:TonB-dependent receptor [Sphingopyxis sp. XHP0097]|uniref:TonB-dependent receptor n=1 Tax=Sphingopyxis jiangsuensis TaxID=2871171 RepID=A0ABS7MGF1_9SPHN|nr:TonB-dependent receptor [Sphingopyxis jiangsuensis]MBY4637759.1 TonB-dependent receptor [Sphingopyxis jiangsuensis]
MIRKIAVAMLATSALATPAFAEEAPAGGAEHGNAIIVTAARTILPANALPLTVDLIDKAALDEQLAISGSVTDAVATLTPSFSPTRQKLSGAGETLRGRSPLHAINGIPQSTPLRDGSRDGFTIDGFFVDRVELIYGSNALQGIGGTGGIVNQVTVGAPVQEGVSGRVLLQGTADNEFSDAGMGGKAAGLVQYKADRFDASVGAAYELRGIFRDGEGRPIGINLTQGETQDSQTLSLFGRFGYEVTDTMRLDLIASRFELEGDGDYMVVAGNRATGLPTSQQRGTPPGVPATNRTESLALSLTDSDLGGGNFVSQIFWNRSRDTFGGEPNPIATFQDAAIAPVGTLFDQSQNRSRKYGGKLSYERALPGFEALTLIAGFDALWDTTEQRLIATGRSWVPPTDFRSLAPFGQANLKLAGGLVRLAGGARYENVKISIDDYTTLASSGSTFVSGGRPTFDDVLLNGGVIVEPVAGIRAYASYAEGYTVPDVGRITRSVSTPGTDIDDFLDIAPIVSNNREIGFEVKRGPLDASAAYFWSSSKNGQRLQAGPDGIFTVERERVEIEGLEINLAVRTPIDGLTLSAGYAHIVGRYDSDDDNVVDTDLDGANISPDRLNLAAGYAKGPFSARVQTQFYLARTFDGPNRDTRNDFEGYALTDAFVRYQTAIGGLSLAVQNLFDKQYISYASDTQRPTDNFFNFAGRGRTFTLGWDYRF